MAWTPTSITGNLRNILILEETYTLPASAITGYSSVIDGFGPNMTNNNRYIAVTFLTSALSGSNLDMSLYGATKVGGTKVQLLDVIVADISNGDGIVAGLIDLNAYPAGVYYLAWLADTNEAANTIAVQVMGAV